jgi:hypothetical protein
VVPSPREGLTYSLSEQKWQIFTYVRVAPVETCYEGFNRFFQDNPCTDLIAVTFINTNLEDLIHETGTYFFY